MQCAMRTPLGYAHTTWVCAHVSRVVCALHFGSSCFTTHRMAYVAHVFLDVSLCGMLCHASWDAHHALSCTPVSTNSWLHVPLICREHAPNTRHAIALGHPLSLSVASIIDTLSVGSMIWHPLDGFNDLYLYALVSCVIVSGRVLFW